MQTDERPPPEPWYKKFVSSLKDAWVEIYEHEKIRMPNLLGFNGISAIGKQLKDDWEFCKNAGRDVKSAFRGVSEDNARLGQLYKQQLRDWWDMQADDPWARERFLERQRLLKKPGDDVDTIRRTLKDLNNVGSRDWWLKHQNHPSDDQKSAEDGPANV